MLIVYSLEHEYKPIEGRDFICLVPMYPVWSRVGTHNHSLSDEVITYSKSLFSSLPFSQASDNNSSQY